MRAQIWRRLFLVYSAVALLHALPTWAQVQSDVAIKRDTAFRDFKAKMSTPPRAYLHALSYLHMYGIDDKGLEIKKWIDAYRSTAPAIYARHDIDFGLYSDHLDLYLHSVLWANRAASLAWAATYPHEATIAWVQQGNTATGWWTDMPRAPGYGYSAQQNVVLWADGDWQGFDINGAPMNAANRHPDLTSELHRLADGTLPSGLYVSPAGGWIVTWGKNQFRCSPTAPQELCSRLSELRNQGYAIRQISFGSHDSWLVLYGANGGYWHGIPPAMLDTWKRLVQQNRYFECASVFFDDSWFIKVRTPIEH
jgi:hypothetical protein